MARAGARPVRIDPSAPQGDGPSPCRTHYNAFAGGDVGRIEALSDGIFAFAATVLVLDFRSPEPADIHSEAELLSALARLVAPAHALASQPAHARHLLGRPTDAAQPTRALEPRPDLAASGVSRDHHRLAVHDPAAGGFLHLPHSVPDLLGQHLPARRGRLRHLGLFRTGETAFGKTRPRSCWARFGGGSSSPNRFTPWARLSVSSACRSGLR